MYILNKLGRNKLPRKWGSFPGPRPTHSQAPPNSFPGPPNLPLLPVPYWKQWQVGRGLGIRLELWYEAEKNSLQCTTIFTVTTQRMSSLSDLTYISLHCLSQEHCSGINLSAHFHSIFQWVRPLTSTRRKVVCFSAWLHIHFTIQYPVGYIEEKNGWN